MLNFLSDNLAIVSLLLVTLLVLALLAVVVSAALRGPGQDGGAIAAAPKLGTDSLRQSFRTALELIEGNLATRAERYKLCWTLVLDEGSGAGLPLAQSGLPSALSTDHSQRAAALGVGWHFFDQGVVAQLQASQLGSPDPDSAANTGIWDDFIALCRKYRPQRPFDAIVLALPCSALLADDAQGLQELAARAHLVTVLPERRIFETLMERERLGTTGVGQGIAIPHGRLAGLNKIVGMFARLETAIAYDAVDNQPVDLVFLLLAPEGAGADHLKALARVSRLLRNQQTCEKLRAAKDPEVLYALLTEKTNGGASSQAA